MPLSIGNIILLKEKGGMRESFPKQVDKKSRGPKERGVWNSQGGRKDTFFSSTFLQLSSVLSLSRVWLFATPWIAAHQASLSITNSRSSLKLMSIESVKPSSHLILCRPLLLLPPIPPSIRVFSNQSPLHEVAKILEFQLQHHSLKWTPRTDLL